MVWIVSSFSKHQSQFCFPNIGNISSSHEAIFGFRHSTSWDEDTSFFEATSNFISSLPRSITNLTLADVNLKNELVCLLPPGLTFLSLPRDIILSDSGLARLPSLLRHLDLRRNHIISSAGLAPLPRELSYLNISQRLLLKDSDLVHLTHHIHLQTLIMSYCKNITWKCVELLPRSLTKVVFSQYTVFTDESVSHLPQSLTNLTIGRINPASPGNWGKTIHWPPNLKKLSIVDSIRVYAASNIYSPDDEILYLPQTLRTLQIYAPNILTDDAFVNLPPNLLHLRVEHNNVLTNGVIPLLPKSLLSLCINGNSNFTGAGLANLPRGLQVLSFDEKVNIRREDLALLPPHLKELKLKRASKYLGGKSLQLLPRGLLELNFSGMRKYNMRYLSSLPPSLRSLKIGLSKDYSFPVPSLPRSLTRIRLGDELCHDDGDTRRMRQVICRNLPPGLKWMKRTSTSPMNLFSENIDRAFRFIAISILACLLIGFSILFLRSLLDW